MSKNIISARYEKESDTIREVPSNRCMINFEDKSWNRDNNVLIPGSVKNVGYDVDAGIKPRLHIIKEAYNKFLKIGSEDKELLAHFISKEFIRVYLNTIKLVKGDGFKQTFFTKEILSWENHEALRVNRDWAVLEIGDVKIELILLNSEDDVPVYEIYNAEEGVWNIKERFPADLNEFSEEKMYDLLIESIIRNKLL